VLLLKHKVLLPFLRKNPNKIIFGYYKMSNILPFEIISTLTVNRFEIDSIDIRLFTSAVIRVNLFDLNGFRVSVKNVLMEGEDYSKWGNDDQYIVSFVINSLGFTPTVTVEPIIEPTIEPTITVEPIIEEPTVTVEEPIV